MQREILSEGAPCSLNKEEIPYGLVKKNNGGGFGLGGSVDVKKNRTVNILIAVDQIYP